MDYTSMTFVGLITVGVVNVVSFFLPTLKSEYKFAISIVVAFLLTFVPVELGSVLADKVKLALEVSFGASGAYKLISKAGGA
jgi:hypothetical protein